MLYQKALDIIVCAGGDDAAGCRDTLLTAPGAIYGGLVPSHVASLMWHDRCEDKACALFAREAATTNGTTAVKIAGAGQHFALEFEREIAAFAWALPASVYVNDSDEVPESCGSFRVEAGEARTASIPFHVRYLKPKRRNFFRSSTRIIHLPPPLVLGEDGNFLDLHIPLPLAIRVPVAPGGLALTTTLVTLVVMFLGLFVAIREMRQTRDGAETKNKKK